MQVLINWRNSLPIRERYILYMYTATVLSVYIFHPSDTMDTKCRVQIGITELF